MKYILPLLLIFFFARSAAAQTEEATTQSGKKVILYADGTWKYANETADNTKPRSKEPVKEKKQAEPVSTDISGNCNGLLETTEDSKSGIRITRTINRLIVSADGKKQIGISLQKNSKGILTLNMYPLGAGSCIGEGNRVNIEFTDGTKLEMVHNTFGNCNGEMAVSFGGNAGNKKQLETLKIKKIKKLKVWTQEGSVQQELGTDVQDTLLQLFNCLGT